MLHLVLAKVAVVAEDLADTTVQGEAEGAPEGDGVGDHVDTAARVDLPEAVVLLVGGLVELLELRDLVLRVDESHFDRFNCEFRGGYWWVASSWAC